MFREIICNFNLATARSCCACIHFFSGCRWATNCFGKCSCSFYNFQSKMHEKIIRHYACIQFGGSSELMPCRMNRENWYFLAYPSLSYWKNEVSLHKHFMISMHLKLDMKFSTWSDARRQAQKPFVDCCVRNWKWLNTRLHLIWAPPRLSGEF